MSYVPQKQHYFVLFFVVFVFASIAITELIHQNLSSLRQERVEAKAKDQLSILSSNLEASLTADIYKVSTLATVITSLPNRSGQELDMIANHILEKSHHITSIGIAPNDVISRIYPLLGNEAAVGLDYRSQARQWTQVQKAKEIEGIFIAGPIRLVQGGEELVVRVPVFRDPPINSQYWGMVSATVDFKALLRDTGVIDFSNHYHLLLRGYDSSGQFGDVFFGHITQMDKVLVKTQVQFPYGGWSLEIYQNGEVDQQGIWYVPNAIRLVGYSSLLLISIAMLLIYRLYQIANSRALHDELTLLPNRRYFMQSLQQQFEIAKRYKKRYRFALINIDLDKFKLINDTYGHSAGDKVLIACAQRVKNSLRRSDIVARVGGDEFLVLVHNPENEVKAKILTNKLKMVLSSTPVMYEDKPIYFQASVGYAMFYPELESPEVMIKMADEWMYRQKHDSR